MKKKKNILLTFRPVVIDFGTRRVTARFVDEAESEARLKRYMTEARAAAAQKRAKSSKRAR